MSLPCSPAENSASESFSPGRSPVWAMRTSLRPDSRIKVRATSTIFTCSPMSSTITSPSEPMAADCSTSWQASGMSMKNRSTSGCVTVTGPPRAIWAVKAGTTDPREPSTLPKRTLTKRPRLRRA